MSREHEDDGKFKGCFFPDSALVNSEESKRKWAELERMTPWWQRLWRQLLWREPLIRLNPRAIALKATIERLRAKNGCPLKPDRYLEGNQTCGLK